MSNDEYTVLVLILVLFSLEAVRSKNVKSWLTGFVTGIRSQVTK